MRTSEWVTVAYFAYLLATALALRVPTRALRSAAVYCVPALALIGLTVSFDSPGLVAVLRDWLPGGYLLAGYWATGRLYRGPDRSLEAWLDAIDRRVFSRLGGLIVRAPRTALELLELAYLLCYPLVPAGLVVLYVAGSRAHADAYWTLVLVSAFLAYAPLPWAGTRPPRTLGSEMGIDRRHVAMRRVNLRVLHRGSIQVNTFPSGHAASACAAAFFLVAAHAVAWPIFAVVAAAICLSAIVGRYHYTADVLAGIAIAVVVFVAVM